MTKIKNPIAKKTDGIEKVEKPDETKEILLDDEEKVVDPEVLSVDALADEEEEDEEGATDDDEVDPFKDRWEE